ncbi:MAG: TIGR00374 family protein [Bacteroidetes bacterium CG12_big_fil_rev_8_21_14_0_65_60_17]|nr:MAG: TIGR00374 family protein [Bacteroidetes bacterium CG12_big_fil_rev_8_21_14_0_65_60_17]
MNNSSAPHISIINVVWPILLGLAVMGLIAYYTWDEGILREMARAADPVLLAGAVAIAATRVVAGGWRLSFISRHGLSFVQGIKAQIAWDFASNVSPSVVGGAPLSAWYMVRESERAPGRKGPMNTGDATAVMTFTLLLDQIWFALAVPVVLVTALFWPVIPPEAGRFGLWTLVVYFLVFTGYTVVFAYATLVRPSVLVRITNRVFRLPLLRRYSDKVALEMDHFQDRAAVLRRQPKDFFILGVLLTALTWVARYSLVVFILWSFVPDIDRGLLFIRSVAMTMSSLIMPTPGGAGGIEALYALFYGSLLPDTAYIAPSLLLWRFLGYYVFIALGIALTTRYIQRRVAA